MAWLDDTWDWFQKVTGMPQQSQAAIDHMRKIKVPDELEEFWKGLADTQKNDYNVLMAYKKRQSELSPISIDPVAGFIEERLKDWVEYTKTFSDVTPENAQKTLSELSAKVIEIFAASAAIDMALAAIPTTTEGVASSANTKEWVKWLGFGAVIAAVAHDPVKIGILRPYQDSLEATFRNRRPEYTGILNAYRQRSLSTIPITDINDITDELMDKVEADNIRNMDTYGAQWGYPDKWITIDKDAATRAMTFGNLSSMARMGHYDRKLAIFSLWTYGLDRRLMYAGLNALETMRDVGLWKGFRSMVEPGYVQGIIEEADLREYWNKILVPAEVQDWTLLRLTKSRERYAEKEAKAELGKQRDLTRADFVKAYNAGIIDLAALKTKLSALGYDAEEIDVIVKLADASKKTAAPEGCKRLPLSDYELAHRNGLATMDKVLQRMAGEYCQADIDLEKQLLEIDDLTTDAPAQERDLSVSEITAVFVDGAISAAEMDTYLEKLGFDEQERAWLTTLAEVKKAAADAKAAKAAGKAAVQKERDLTRADWTFEYVHNRISQTQYETALAGLKYDASEIEMLVDIANVKKKLPGIEGLKRLPLSDYEKAMDHGLIPTNDVIARMQGEYSEADISLEKLMIANGIHRKG